MVRCCFVTHFGDIGSENGDWVTWGWGRVMIELKLKMSGFAVFM